MKTLVGLAVAAALSAGVAHAAITPPGPNTGELVEFVVDETNGQVYARGTGVIQSSVLPGTSILSNTAWNALTSNSTKNVPVSQPFTLPTLGPDSLLTSFLATKTDGVHTDTFNWGIVGAGTQNISGAGPNGPGGNISVFTSANTIAASNLGVPSNTQNANNETSIANDITTLNGIIAGSNGDKTSAMVSAQFNSGSAIFGLYANNIPTVSAMLAQVNLYSTTGQGGTQPNGANNAEIYTAGLVTMLADGTLEAVAGAVPLPGAVWLLGSGLLGLLGITRRRSALKE